MKARNYHVWGDQETVNRLLEEYTFIGRQAKIVEPGHLVVFAFAKKQKQEKEKGVRPSRKNTYSQNK